jgi:hypothetical protein
VTEKKRRYNIENLKSWKPGQSGNPNGYSRKRRIYDRLCEILDRKRGDTTIEEALCEAAVVEGLNGSIQHFIAIRDSVDGKPRQSFEVSGPEGNAISFNIGDVEGKIAEYLGRGRSRASASRGKNRTSATAGTKRVPSATERTS